MIAWGHIGATVLTSFSASLVEFVEALTIVLAVGVSRNWRSSLSGAAGGLLVLVILAFAFGPLLDGRLLSIAWLQTIIGILLLIFGLRWMRKAVLRAAGIIPLRDEDRVYKKQVNEMGKRRNVRNRFDIFACVASFKAVLLEGIEVVFVVVAVGAAQSSYFPAALGALAALLFVMSLGVLMHRPLSRIPENSLKYGVSVLLCAFGLFWIGEGRGLGWPAGDLAVAGLACVIFVVSFSLIAYLKARKPVILKNVQQTKAGKIPQVTLAFWIIKIAATTFGETAGDALSMTMKLGYAVSTAIFFIFFLALLMAQVKARTFHTLLYWAVIVATTTVGTTTADFFDRSLGIGYVGGVLALAALLICALAAWRLAIGHISLNGIATPRAEIFYWTTILFSNTLGTALGDFLATDLGLGYEGGSVVFGGMLGVISMVYFLTKMPRTSLFWAAFILTRPLGATLGDLLTKPHAGGGFNLDRINSSLVIGVFMIACIMITPQRATIHRNTTSA